MTAKLIRDLFSSDIDRRIEEVIKVDQTDAQIVTDELQEYVFTDSIREQFIEILERYAETPNKPHEGVGIWVSGFFGSGKSSFAKNLGLALENRKLGNEHAGKLLSARAQSAKISTLLSNIAELIPTDAVVFDVSTDRGIRSGNQTLTEITYRLFLRSMGYASDLDLSELEITLEEEDRLDAFISKYEQVFGKTWDKEKGKVAIAVQQASRVMHELDPDTFATVDSWRESAMNRADITPGLLAERSIKLVERRHPGRQLVFVIDEVGQFVARDVQKMLDLMGLVQSLGRIGRGKAWLVVTSQEKLTELVGGLDDKRVELARLMDRFPLQVHLETSDISEVTSRRVLAKNAEAEGILRKVFEDNRGRLATHVKVTADINLPNLDAESFIDLYPLLPYQIDLIIQVVSGLRTQGGASKHVGGANRTIIKIAQQLLVHPETDLGSKEIGVLARIDQVYDLVRENISSQVRTKIDAILDETNHSMAQPVAKAICLLQYVRSIHTTAENIAATLHSSVGSDSRLPEVREAIIELEQRKLVRQGENGYRIPTPAEDDWENRRGSLQPKPGDASRLYAEAMQELWKPQPKHKLQSIKDFSAGLVLNGRKLLDGDILFHMSIKDSGKEYDDETTELRRRSQSEQDSLFWVFSSNSGIDRQMSELYRSNEMLSLKERSARTKDEMALIAEEKLRARRAQTEFSRLLTESALAGNVYFRGNDRSPEPGAVSVSKSATRILGEILPDVFHRFNEAAARVSTSDLDALLTNENLRGLPAVFSELSLLTDESGQPVIDMDARSLAEIMASIKDRTSYGDQATGKFLTESFAREPFGWGFDVIRMFVATLLRAGKIECTSKGKRIEKALSLDAKAAFTNNNLFRQMSFRPKEGIHYTQVADAATHFEELFGTAVAELEESKVADEILAKLYEQETQLQDALNLLSENSLPGGAVLKQAMDAIRELGGATSDRVILAFNASHAQLKEAFKRSGQLTNAVGEAALELLNQAQEILHAEWPALRAEEELEEAVGECGRQLEDLLLKETFFRDLADIERCAATVRSAYNTLHREAVASRCSDYEIALENLATHPNWKELTPEQQDSIATPLRYRTTDQGVKDVSIELLREQAMACPGLLESVLAKLDALGAGSSELIRVNASSYFGGGVETEEQLDQALDGLRQECIEHIAEGKRVVLK